MTLKLALNFSCSIPVGSKLIIMLPITLSVNCTKGNSFLSQEKTCHDSLSVYRT